MKVHFFLAALSSALVQPGSAERDPKLRGLDNNWKVNITGLEDEFKCFQLSSIVDLAPKKENVPGYFPARPRTDRLTCVKQSGTCDAGGYDPGNIKKPTKGIGGCNFKTGNTKETTYEGYILDNLCVENFIINQKDNNGSPGTSPDKVYVRDNAEEHTRACLLVDYCAKTGFDLVSKKDGNSKYTRTVRIAKASGDTVFSFIRDTRREKWSGATDSPVAAGGVPDVPPGQIAKVGSTTVTVKEEEGDQVAVVTSTDQVWVAFGLTTSSAMGGARALIYQPNVAGECTDQVSLIIDMVYDPGRMAAMAADPDRIRTGLITACSMSEAGSSFTIKLNESMFLSETEGSDSEFYLKSLLRTDNPNYEMGTADILIAQGNTKAFAQHGGGKRVFAGVDIAGGAAGAELGAVCLPTAKTGPVAQHGALMVISWGILIPLGVFIARFLKGKRSWWFQFHRSCQSLGLVLALAGWIVALQNFELVDAIFDGDAEFLTTAQRAHAIIGCVVMLIGLLQPLNAFVRPHPPESGDSPTTMRFAWEVIHKGSGRGATLFGLANVFIGFDLVRERYGCVWMDVIWIGVIVGVAFLVIAGVYLTIRPLNNGTPLQTKSIASAKGHISAKGGDVSVLKASDIELATVTPKM